MPSHAANIQHHPLTLDERSTLLRLAREAIARRLAVETPPVVAEIELTSRLLASAGAFVTLRDAGGELRGCIGLPYPAQPLYEAVIEAAGSAALEDPRFLPVGSAELPALKIEISVLSLPAPVVPPGAAPRDIAAAVIPGVHGLIVSHGSHRGLLLPQVASEAGWSSERFLSETCRKAGLSLDAWQHGARVEAFTAEIIQE